MIDLDDTVFKYSEHKRKFPELQYPQNQPDFFYSLEPFEGAIEAIKRLMKIYDVWILTAPSYMNEHSYTGKRISIERHFDLEFCKKLIICCDKSLIKADILVDDNAFGKGQDRFEGELIQFGTPRFPDWNVVESYLTNH